MIAVILIGLPWVLATVTVLGLFACGSDSSGPHIDPQAAHFDSLARAAGRNGDFVREGALSTVALAYQAGIEPATVTVQDSGTPTVYRATVVRNSYAHPDPESGATGFWELVLWQEPDGARFIFATGQADSASLSVSSTPSLLHFGQINWGTDDHEEGGADGYVLLSPNGPSGTCALTNARSICSRVSFTVSIEAAVKPFLQGTDLVNYDAPPHPIVAASQLVSGLGMAPR